LRRRLSAVLPKYEILRAESIFRICKGSETILTPPLLVAKYSTIFRQRQGNSRFSIKKRDFAVKIVASRRFCMHPAALQTPEGILFWAYLL